MAEKEYIDREAAINVVINNPYRIASKTGKTIQEIKKIPTADVAPKSEVDKYKQAAKIANEEYEKVLNHYLIDTGTGNGTPLQRAKQEVAREIFEDIDNAFCKMLSVVRDGIAKAKVEQDEESLRAHKNILPIVIAIRDCVAELKKKYTNN